MLKIIILMNRKKFSKIVFKNRQIIGRAKNCGIKDDILSFWCCYEANSFTSSSKITYFKRYRSVHCANCTIYVFFMLTILNYNLRQKVVFIFPCNYTPGVALLRRCIESSGTPPQSSPALLFARIVAVAWREHFIKNNVYLSIYKFGLSWCLSVCLFVCFQ